MKRHQLKLLYTEIEILRSILERLAAYKIGRLPFHQLIADLDVAIDVLEQTQPLIANELRESWLALEEVNALALDEQDPVPLEVHIGIISRALDTLQKSISRCLLVE